MKNIETKIKKVYSDLQQLGISARITVRANSNMLYDYPIFNDLILREQNEDDCLFMEDRVKVVIKIESENINRYGSIKDELKCTDRKSKSILGGNVTYFWQDDVNAILGRGDGAYCFGKTLREAVRCCEALINNISL